VTIVGGSLLISHLTRNQHFAIYTQIACITMITVLIQWSIGGIYDSGVVMIWAFVGPICSLMFFSVRRSIPWFGLYFLNIGLTVLFNDYFSANAQPVTDATRNFFFGMNLGTASLVVLIFTTYYVNTAKKERAKAERLLLNVLPKEIAPVLKANNSTIADYFPSARVLFADIVGSTPLFANLEPAEALAWLNEIFSMFDQLVEKYSLEKIRTIGDNYMVAGVIGKTKFHYDIWGDTVNTAVRMEEHGETGKTQITAATYELIKNDFVCSP
jgi:guanylate cyclase